MGAAKDSLTEEKEAKADKRRKKARKQTTRYEDVKIPRSERRNFRDTMPSDSALMDWLVEVVEGEGYTFTAGLSKDETSLKMSLHDNSLPYNQRTYLTAYHAEMLTAVALLRHGYVVVFEGVPENGEEAEEDFNW